MRSPTELNCEVAATFVMKRSRRVLAVRAPSVHSAPLLSQRPPIPPRLERASRASSSLSSVNVSRGTQVSCIACALPAHRRSRSMRQPTSGCAHRRRRMAGAVLDLAARSLRSRRSNGFWWRSVPKFVACQTPPESMGNYPTMIRLLVMVVVLRVPYGTAGATTALCEPLCEGGCARSPTMSAMRSRVCRPGVRCAC